MARLDPLSPRGRSEGNKPLPDKARPGIGITLLVLDTSMDIDAIVRAFRARGLRSVNTPLATNAQDIVSDWRPRAVVLQAGTPDWSELLRFLIHRDVSTVLLGSSEQFTKAESRCAGTVHLIMPVEAAEIAEAAELVIGPASARGLPDVIDLGLVNIDLRSRVVEIEERQVDLPPKEFEILVQLSLQPGQPVRSEELVRKLWPGSSATTVDDVHARVFRLRRLIGDHDRADPLIRTRRGYGYVLTLSTVKVD